LAVDEVDRFKDFKIDVGAGVLRTNNQIIEHVNDHLLELSFGVLDQRVSLGSSREKLSDLFGRKGEEEREKKDTDLGDDLSTRNIKSCLISRMKVVQDVLEFEV
jgi:hypothetical protein